MIRPTVVDSAVWKPWADIAVRVGRGIGFLNTVITSTMGTTVIPAATIIADCHDSVSPASCTSTPLTISPNPTPAPAPDMTCVREEAGIVCANTCRLTGHDAPALAPSTATARPMATPDRPWATANRATIGTASVARRRERFGHRSSRRAEAMAPIE